MENRARIQEIEYQLDDLLELHSRSHILNELFEFSSGRLEYYRAKLQDKAESSLYEGIRDNGEISDELFSIYMIGTTTGYYYRVGDAEQFGDVASSLIGAASKTSDDEATWKKFLSKGKYTAANGILTFTSDKGEVEEFQYSVADGYLTLTAKGVDVTGGNEAAANVTGVINSILAIAGRSEKIDTNVGIVYRYKKIGIADLKNLFTKE